jgi:hypothetical protein
MDQCHVAKAMSKTVVQRDSSIEWRWAIDAVAAPVLDAIRRSHDVAIGEL